MKRNAISPLGAAEAGRKGAMPLNPVEVEAMHFFVQLSRALGQPPSVAEIYGLLFVSPKPLNQEDLINRINLSKGSASQGLRYLLDLGAVRTVYMAGDRRAHYEAVAELRNLASRFLHQQILTHFDDSGDRLQRLGQEARKLSHENRDFVLGRVATLKTWRKKFRILIPIATKLLGRNGKSVLVGRQENGV